jgi:hypothetical protein
MLKKIKEKINAVPSLVKSSVVGSGLLAFAGSASADVAGSISTAFSDATTNVTSVATGVIALAAIVTGVGLIISFLRR